MTRAGRRLRIAYLVHGVGGRQTGVHAKINAQARAWAALDPQVEVGIFVRCESGTEADWEGQPHVVAVASSRLGIAGRLLARERLSWSVMRWRPDLIYLRQSTVSPSIVALALRHPVVVELNTIDLSELRVQSPLRYWYARLTRDLPLRGARGLVAVSSEIARHPSVVRLRKPIAVVPNSVDLDETLPLPPTENTEPRLLFVGTPGQSWHGVDKIAVLARHFPSWTFDVVGPDQAALPQLPNVVMHGSIPKAELRPIMARADVAISSLAPDRIGMTELSPLKVGDYLAAGLPAIAGHIDTRFPDGATFLLTLPSSEDNVEQAVERIRSFVLGWLGRRVERAAVASIDTRQIERKRLDFMLGCLPRKRNRD